MEKFCRNDWLACRVTEHCPDVLFGWKSSGLVRLCLTESVPGSCFQASTGVRNLTATMCFMFRSSDRFFRVG